MTKRILVADDALIIREIIKDTATEAGWQVVGEAENGKQAYERFCEHLPDVMTLDMVMPEYDGLYALRNIMEQHPDAKVVVVSALDQKSVLKDAMKIGASDFIVKPFQHQALLETLEKVVA